MPLRLPLLCRLCRWGARFRFQECGDCLAPDQIGQALALADDMDLPAPDQHLRHARRAGRDDDRVDRELLAQVGHAVPMHQPHVLELERSFTELGFGRGEDYLREGYRLGGGTREGGEF